MEQKIIENQPQIQEMPMLPLRGMVAFPLTMIHFDVERRASVAAVNAALNGNQYVFLLTQRDAQDEDPTADSLYEIGTICEVKQILRVPGHGMRVMVEGIARAKLSAITTDEPYFTAQVTPLSDLPVPRQTSRTEALIRQCQDLFHAYTNLQGNSMDEMPLFSGAEIGQVADFIALNIFVRHEEKQAILEERNPLSRLKRVIQLLTHEVEVLAIRNELQEKATSKVHQTQRDFFLREQLKVIRAELGDEDLPVGDDGSDYKTRILALKLSAENEEKLLKEISRLEKQYPGSADATVIQNYLDIVLELPWNKTTRERLDLAAARKTLDADHFGMEKVKERVIEFLAVRKLAPNVKGGILCLVGPPGVGKTSIAAGIAAALNRKFARISLGGVHDEAEIRGHRKTYIGAMPGRIMNAMRQAGSCNPVLLLDEVDKMGADYRGDPSAALLEALDSEQNTTFRDHYLELAFDLSNTLFVTTANTLDTIPLPLLDRMEIIHLGSYTDEEKLQIAKQHLLPKQRRRHGLSGHKLRLSDAVLRDMIAGYTRESGVRQLEREIAKICRKIAAAIAEKHIDRATVKAADLPELLGTRRYRIDAVNPVDEVGLARGLAWTRVGGEMLDVEVIALDGTGKLELTGNLGNVMKESARAARSYIRSRAAQFGIDAGFYKTMDIHIHFPEGATPKDGPSAGITIAVAMLSALTNAPVRRDIAMTGEISLRGRILPIGGLKEKTMAARRANIRTVIIPKENERDLEEIDQTVRSALQFIIADHLDDILDDVLCLPNKPITHKTFSAKTKKLKPEHRQKSIPQ